MNGIVRYLALSGLLANLAAATVLVHFGTSGLTLHQYVSRGVQTLDRGGSSTRPVARVAQYLLLDSGLIADPDDRYPRHIDFELPRWRGDGANALRRDTAPRYTAAGMPIPITDSVGWNAHPPPRLTSVPVDSVAGLRAALREAVAGSEIVLAPGTYRLDGDLALDADGSAEKPLRVRGADIGSTIVELAGGARLAVRGSYWVLSDLILRGGCGEPGCEHAVQVETDADALTVRNLFASGFRHLLGTAPGTAPAVVGLIDAVTVVGGTASDDRLHWPRHALREIRVPPGPRGMVVLCTPPGTGGDCDTDRLTKAVRRVEADGLVLIRSGTYRQAATIKKPGLHLLAEPGAKLYGAAVRGKGALVTRADVTIEGLECSHVKVPDGNGTCLRQESGDVTLHGVHFHHAQMGLLSGHRGGHIRIYDSYFHGSGFDESGSLGHNVYVNSGVLEFVRSWSLAARNAGHELKSRAARTLIRDSLIASLNARDSRLIDTPLGGLLEVRDSVLGEGPRSENWDLIGYGLEVKGKRKAHPAGRIIVTGNTIFIDRARDARLMQHRHADAVQFTSNVVIGNAAPPEDNAHFRSRRAAGVGDYPQLRPVTQ